MDSPSKTLENDNITIIKKKIVAFDKLLKHKEKIESKCEELTGSVAQKDSEISRLNREVENLKKDMQEKIAKISHLEMERQKKSQQIGQLDSALGKKHSDFIYQEVELNKLKREIEDLKAEREKFEEQLKNNSQVKKMREEYEDEKWKQLAEIAGLKQSNASLKEMMKETNDFAKTLQTEVRELDKYKQEARQSQVEGAKKDRLVASLTRKLDKLSSELRKKGAVSAMEFDIPDSPVRSCGSRTNVTPTPPPSQRRFVIFNARRDPGRKKRLRRVKFCKLGPVEMGDMHWVLGQLPVITDAVPAADQPPTEDSNLSLASPLQENEAAQSVSRKRRNERTPTSPRKRQKRLVSPVFCSEDLISPLSSSTPEHNGDKTLEGAWKLPPAKATIRASTEKKQQQMTEKLAAAETVAAAPQHLRLGPVEGVHLNGVASLCFNPNPVKGRQAHHRVGATLPLARTPDKQAKLLATKKAPEVEAATISVSLGKQIPLMAGALARPILPLDDTSTTGLSARQKILQEGIKAEVR